MPRKNPEQITYSDNFQSHYRYTLIEPVGKNFHPDFEPELTPREMLELGVFGGAYFIGVPGRIPDDLPKIWFKKAVLAEGNVKHAQYNYYKVSASQSLEIWRKKGWIGHDDPHGWFQWYCRYYLGRRIPGEDDRQIKRWKAIARHIAQIKNNCKRKDQFCRIKQRQAVLHWAYDPRNI